MFEIRNATFGDSATILNYIKALAIAEKFPFEVIVEKQDIEENLFGSGAPASALIFYYDNKPCGFAVFYFSFSTTTGKKGLHLDDLYIEPQYQGKGFGKIVLSYLSSLALQNDCSRFEWWVLRTNVKAIKLYENIGAKKLDEIFVYRLDNIGMKILSDNSMEGDR